MPPGSAADSVAPPCTWGLRTRRRGCISRIFIRLNCVTCTSLCDSWVTALAAFLEPTFARAPGLRKGLVHRELQVMGWRAGAQSQRLEAEAGGSLELEVLDQPGRCKNLPRKEKEVNDSTA